MSGLRGEIGELEETLLVIWEKKNDLKATIDTDRIARMDKGRRKKDVGRALLQRSFDRSGCGGTESGGSDKGGSGAEMDKLDGKVSRGRGKRHQIEREDNADLGSLAAALRNTYTARIKIVRGRLLLERERMERE